jgi:hypothetical protein
MIVVLEPHPSALQKTLHLQGSLFCAIIRYKQKRSSMYAIVNVNTQVINYYTTENAASEACRAYNVLPHHKVYIIDFVLSLIEQL